jgi:predicted lipoprotein with Yx(FWY)xxD motif
MNRRGRATLGAGAVTPALVIVGDLAIAAFGSSGSSTSTNEATSNAGATPSPSASASSDTVDVAHSRLGNILVDSQGRTLYLWQADTGSQSTCGGACAAAWPPLLTSRAPTAGSGVDASLPGTTRRSGGAAQATYNQHPLYLFKGDAASGQTNGQGSTGFSATWHVLSPASNQITGSASATASAGGSGSSNGY